jgi:hypothetical protein
MALRELLVHFGVSFDGKQLDAANQKIDAGIGKLRDFGTALAGAFAATKIKDFVFGLANQADHLRDQSRMLGFSIQNMQAWQHAANLNGVKADEFATSIVRLNRNMAEAAKGTGPAVEAFNDLGIKQTEIGKLDANATLERLAVGFSKVQDPAKRTALAMDLFGRAGAKLLPLFAEGPEGIKKLREEMSQLGGGITQEFADQSDELNDNLARLDMATLSLKVKIAGILIPAFTAAVTWFTKMTGSVRKLLEGSRLLESAFIVLGSVAAAQAAILIAKWAPILKAFGKTTLLIALAVLLLEDLIGTFEGKDSVIRRIIDGWFGEGATQKVVDWFKGIADGFSTMVDDARFRNDEFRATWDATLEDIRNDFEGTFGGAFLGELLAAAVDTFFVAINAIAGGWSGAVDTIKALLEGLFFSFQVVWEDIMHVTLAAIAKVSDAATAALNLAAKIPGLGDLGTDTSAPGYVSASDREKGRRQLAEGDLYAKAQSIDARLRGPNQVAQRAGTSAATNAREAFADLGFVPGQPMVSAPVNITQNFPPGTPAQTQRAAAQGAADGASRGVNRGAAAAFTQRGKK